MNNLNRITARFDRAYTRNKKAKEWLDRSQQRLFEELTNDLKQGVLAQRVVDIPEGQLPSDYIQTNYPGWTLDYLSRTDTEPVRAVIQEDPSLMKHEYVNQETGRVYGRTTVSGSPSLDDERLRADDPELWERISVWPEPWYGLVHGVINDFTGLTWEPASVDASVGEYLEQAGVLRVLKNMDDIDTMDLAELQDYLIPGKVSVRLLPPRKAKPEELEDNE